MRGQGFDRVAERIYQYEEVESCYLMSGDFDMTVILSGKTLREVALFVSQKLSAIDEVKATATHFILKKYKENHLIFPKQEEQQEGFSFV
jgi:DNA-binding Lrp family transcriptional regulator